MDPAAAPGRSPSPPAAAPSPRRRLLLWVSISLLALGAAVAVKIGRWHFLPKNFAVLEPDLFRSGQLREGPLEAVVEERGIRTILRLNTLAPDHPMLAGEEAVAARHGVHTIFIPMNGRGTAPFDDLEQAAAILADRSRRPLLFHCWGGDRRSSAVMAVYRLKECGWSWERTLRELADFGIRPGEDPTLVGHLERYCRERIGKRL